MRHKLFFEVNIKTNLYNSFIPVLAFYEKVCTDDIPLPAPYPRQLVTIGNHIRKRRLDLKRSCADVARDMGLHEDTIRFWELGINTPTVSAIQGVIDFLGYDPYYIDVSTLGGKIKQYRYSKGLSLLECATEIGVYPSLIPKWEENKFKPNTKCYRKLIAWLETTEITE